jgi:protein-disulfide isomerase/uncharacterized membrane protein
VGSRARVRILIALCLCLAGASVSGVLLGEHYGEGWAVSAVKANCGDGQTSGCEEVARSSWSSFAGIPVAAFGLVFYFSLFALLILALFTSPELRNKLAGVAALLLMLGLLIDLMLLGVQAFSIHAYCALCISTYVLSAIALAFLIPACRNLRGIMAAVANPEGRLALAGWVLGALALTACVFGLDATLKARSMYRQATLLFAPASTEKTTLPETSTPVAPAPSVSTESSPGVSTKASVEPQDASYWQKQAKKFESTLEDPNKVEAYYSEKSLRQYDSSAEASIDLKNTPSKGLASAPVTVVEYSDFMCSYCRDFANALSRFVPQSYGRVVVYFKNFPLDRSCNAKLKGTVHSGACNLALGGICAENQGKFDAYHDRVFSTELHNPQSDDVVRIGGEAGMDTMALQSCLDDPKTKAALTAQIAEGNRLGVSGTPTVYINKKKLPRINDFLTIVDKEARKKGFKPLGE